MEKGEAIWIVFRRSSEGYWEAVRVMPSLEGAEAIAELGRQIDPGDVYAVVENYIDNPIYDPDEDD